MNPHSGMNDNYKKDRIKPTVALPMAGAIVTAALLLSGVFLISSYQPAIAQETMTGGGGGDGGGGAATTRAEHDRRRRCCCRRRDTRRQKCY